MVGKKKLIGLPTSKQDQSTSASNVQYQFINEPVISSAQHAADAFRFELFDLIRGG